MARQLPARTKRQLSKLQSTAAKQQPAKGKPHAAKQQPKQQAASSRNSGRRGR